MFRQLTYDNSRSSHQQQQKRFQSTSPKRVIKKCAFDIDSLLKPTNNSSYADDTEDGSSDDGNIHFERSSSPISSYALINQLKTNENRTLQSKIKFKRIRTIFTIEQLERLETEFEKQQYMVGNERLYLAKQLHLSEAQVKIWFQNRRIKWRRQIQDTHSPLE